MYEAYSIIKVSDHYSYLEPKVSVEFSSNHIEDCQLEIEKLFQKHVKEVEASYTEEEKNSDWYQKKVLDCIFWTDIHHSAFCDMIDPYYDQQWSIIKLM